MTTRALLFAAVVSLGAGLACGGGTPAPRAAAATPARPGPPLLEPGGRGAAYLNAIASELQPRWAQFLDDCRLRLPADHPLNVRTLAARARMVIDRSGQVVGLTLEGSGSADFDRAVTDIVGEVATFGEPPFELLSDDDQLHLTWLFARDEREAGPRTATLERLELPLVQVVERLIANGALPRAARRALAAPATAPERTAAAELIMLASIREALGADAIARQAAILAIGRAKLTAFAPEVRALLVPATEVELRLTAVAAAAQMGDAGAVEPLLALLAAELTSSARTAEAVTTALIALGAADRAAAAVRAAIEGEASPPTIALQLHALVPSPAVVSRLEGWFMRGDARVRAAVCDAVPPLTLSPVISPGLRDQDASVRAACLGAARRLGAKGKGNYALIDRVEMRLDDRDVTARARAVAALAVLKPAAARRGVTDPAPEVRRAAIPVAPQAALEKLVSDADPEVRAAALSALPKPSPALLAAAVGDPAAPVRTAALGFVTDPALLTRLASDPVFAIASEAQRRLVAAQGRAAALGPALLQIASAPTGSPQRVRIAQAWLMAPAP